VVVALLAGAANVFFSTAYQVCLPSLVTAAELVDGNAKLQGGASVATIAGRGAAGLAAEAVGAATALLANAASFGVSAACLLAIHPAAIHPAASDPAASDLAAHDLTVPAPAAPSPAVSAARAGGVFAQAWHGIGYVARDPYLRLFTVYAAVSNLAYTGNLALVVVFLVRVVGLGSAAVGLLMAAGGVGGLLGALIAPRLAGTFGTARTLVLTTVASGLAGLLIPLTARGPRIACFVVGSMLVAAAIVVGNVILGSFRQHYCPPALLGRVTASMRFLAFGMIPLGALLAGALGTALGATGGLWIVQAIFAGSAAFLLTPRIRSARNLPDHPGAP